MKLAQSFTKTDPAQNFDRLSQRVAEMFAENYCYCLFEGATAVDAYRMAKNKVSQIWFALPLKEVSSAIERLKGKRMTVEFLTLDGLVNCRFSWGFLEDKLIPFPITNSFGMKK